MKRIISLALVLLVLAMSSLTAFAAPDTLGSDAAGNSNGLVVITKPKNQKDSTFDNSYIISGYGKEGTTVTLYSYSSESGVYKKIYNESQYTAANGAIQTQYSAAEVKIGASGQFINSIPLTQGGNDILLRAENGDKVQLMKLVLTKYNYNLFDIIKSLTD